MGPLSSVAGGKVTFRKHTIYSSTLKMLQHVWKAAAHISISEKPKPNKAVGLNFMLISSIRMLAKIPVILKPLQLNPVK